MKHLPNTITCLNLFSGCLAVIMVLQYGNYYGAFLFIALAAVFDFLDGFAARLLNAKSAIGAQLDSLCDVVSFGVAPGVAVYYFLHGIVFRYPEINFIPYFALLIPVFSALRLAKFNIDTRQTASFLGLPVPADALFWAALIPAANFYAAECGFAILIAFPIIIVIFCLLMVSEVPMFSLKFKNYTWTDNKLPYIQIIGTIFLTSVFGVVGISLAIVLYVLLSLMKK